MKLGTLALSFGLVMGASAFPSAHAAKIIKLGHYNSDTNAQHIALTECFKKHIEEKTGGRYEVRIYPSNQLGSEDQVINGMRNGTIEAGVVGLLMQNTDPIFGVWEWPFLIRDFDHARHVFKSDVAKMVADKFSEYGIKHLAWGINGFRVISSNRTITKMTDFKGLRLRVPTNSMFVDWGNAMGVNPQSMPLSEVFTALEQKVIDGQENPYALLKESGLYEVQSDVLESNHMFTPGMLQMSLKTWNGLSDDDKAIFEEAAALYQERQWELAITAVAAVKESLVKEGNIKITIPSAEFRADMVKAVQPMYENFYAKYPWAKEVVSKINAM